MLGFDMNVSVQASSTKMRQWNILFIELVPIVICLVYWCYMLKTGGSVHNCLVVTQKIGFVFIVFFLCAYLFFEVRWLCFDMYMCDSIWNQPQRHSLIFSFTFPTFSTRVSFQILCK